MENWNLSDLVKEMSAHSIPFSEIKSVRELFEDPDIQTMNLTHKVKQAKNY